jgi:hypothetical protein
MPVPQQFGIGDKMGRGPYEKSGMVADTALHPGKKEANHYEIFFPSAEGQDTSELDLKVQLWYLPYGTMQTDPFLWHEYTERVEVSFKGE